ncbi:MAG: PAS domain-containing protein [Gemmatimonadaceae bacterium]
MLRATERRVLAGYSLALAILGVIALASLGSIQRLRLDAARMQHANEAIGSLEGVLSSALEVGTALRGYLLTGDTTHLAIIARAERSADSTLRALRAMPSLDSAERETLDTAAATLGRRVAVAQEIASIRQAHGLDSARQVWDRGIGVALQDSVRARIRQIQQTERTRAERDREAAERSAGAARLVITLGSVLAIVFVGVSLFLVHRGFVQARESERALRQSNELLDARVNERTAALEKAYHELESSEETLRESMGSIPQQVWISEADGHCSFINARWVEYAGTAPDDLLGQGWLARIHPAERADVGERWRKSVATGDPYQATGRIRGANGEYRWFDLRAVATRAADGRVTRWFGANTDIQVARELQESLREERERLTAVAAVAPALLISYRRRADGHATFVYTGPAVEAFYGFTAEELATDGSLPGQRVHPGDRPTVNKQIAECMDTLTPWHGEYRYQHPTRGEIWLEGHLSPSREADGSVMWQGVVVEVTERKRAETSLRLWAGAFEHCAHGLALGDATTDSIITCNPAYARMVGRSVDEIAGLPILSLHAPAQRERVQRLLKEADWRGAIQFESTMQRADGTSAPVQIDIVAVRDAADQPLFRVATVQDISERRKHVAELGRRATELARSNTDLEQFAYVASHDLQEPLRAVAGCVQLLRKRYAGRLDDRADEYINFAVDGASRMQRLIDDLLTYSRLGRETEQRQVTDSAASLATALANLSVVLQETHAVITSDPMPRSLPMRRS